MVSRSRVKFNRRPARRLRHPHVTILSLSTLKKQRVRAPSQFRRLDHHRPFALRVHLRLSWRWQQRRRVEHQMSVPRRRPSRREHERAFASVHPGVLDDHARGFRDVPGALHARASTTSREGVVLALILESLATSPRVFDAGTTSAASRARPSRRRFLCFIVSASRPRVSALAGDGRGDGTVSGRRRRARVKKCKKCLGE